MVTKETNSDNLTAALEWEAAGCSVIPIRTDGSKKPAVEWKAFQSRRATREEITRWFTANPNYGIAVICGAVSGGLELCELEARATNGQSFDKIQDVADVDFDNWDEWVLGHRTYAEFTPSGGIHLLYRLADGVVPGNSKIANNLANECLAETRGEGGYVIVAPSGGKVHSTGESWTPINGSLPAGIKTIPFRIRNELHGVLRKALDERPAAVPPPPRSEPARVVNPGDELPGEHYERVTSWAEILEPHGWTYSHSAGPEDFWVRPGKDGRDGHSASTGHATDRNRLYVWSSSAGLPTEVPMTKFFVYAELNHNGNTSLAAAELRRLGFGTNRMLAAADENWDGIYVAPEQAQRPEKPVAATESKEPSKRRLMVRFGDTFDMQPVKWLWDQRIPAGELTILAGREGTGKSTMLAKWAAEITTGTMPGEFLGRPRRLIYIAHEDSWEKTIAPRLTAAGTDMRNIISLSLDPECGEFGSPEFPVDCRELEELINKYDVGCVMFDPLLSSISARLDVNKSRELRQALEPLRRVGERTECAIIALAHLNKSTGSDVSSKIAGSRAFTEVARAVFSVGLVPKEESEDEADDYLNGNEKEYVMDQEKNNLGPCDFPGITYKIVTAKVVNRIGKEIITNQIEITGETRVKVGDVLNGTAKSGLNTDLANRITVFVNKNYAKARTLVPTSVVLDQFSSCPGGTVRSILSRQVNKGLLSNPQRGLYGPPGAVGGGVVHALE